MTTPVLVPEAFAEATIRREGEKGRRWILILPSRIEALMDRWDLQVDGEAMHGYLGVVVPVRRGETPLALKVSWIDEWSADEAVALETWAGDGAVQLFDQDRDEGALLLERLDSTRTLEGVGLVEATTTAARLLRRLSVPAPPGLRSLVDEAGGLGDELEVALAAEHPCITPALSGRALELLSTLDLSREQLLVNEDLHYGNVLAGQREPWLVIDPKPLLAVPEYGAAPLVWTRFDELRDRGGVDARLGRIVEEAELDPVETRGWTTLRTLQYWIWADEAGLDRDATRSRRLLGWLQPDWFPG